VIDGKEIIDIRKKESYISKHLVWTGAGPNMSSNGPITF
jgi:hypothetical protein